MRAIVDAKAFYDALKKANAATASKSHFEQMNNVNVTIADGVCRLTGTTFSLWIAAELPAQGENMSFVFSNTGTILNICKLFSGELTLELTVNERPGKDDKDVRIDLSCGGRSAAFRAYEPEGIMHDLPLPEDDSQVYRVNAPALYERVRRVGYAAAKTDVRPGTNGVRFQDKRVWCVDGMRLAANEDDSLIIGRPFILPVSALLHLKELGQTDMTLTVGEKYASFTGEGVSLYCRVLEASDSLALESAIPKEFSAGFMVPRSEYLNEIKYLSECAGRSSKVPVLFDSGKLFVFANEAMFSATMFPDSKYADQYALNLRFVKEALEHLPDSEYISQSSGGRTSPVLITAGADKALIMPVRAGESWGRLEAERKAAV